MNPVLESAVEKLREEAKKVLVEYNSEDGVIIICVGKNPDWTDASKESLTVGTIREVKRKRFLDGHFFSLSEVSKKRRFKFVGSENPTISDLVYEANNTHGGFDMYCEVEDRKSVV